MKERLLCVRSLAKSLCGYIENIISLIDIGCFSHTLDLCGDKIKAPNLFEFMLSWLSLFSDSPKAKIVFKELVGVPIHKYTNNCYTN